MRVPTLLVSLASASFLVSASACGDRAVGDVPSPALHLAPLSAGCNCSSPLWTFVDGGTNTPYVLESGQSLCVDQGTYTGNLEPRAGSLVCVDTDAALAVSQVNMAGRLAVFGTAGGPTTPLSLTFTEGAGLDNFGVTELGSVNFNGAADIVNYRGAELNFRSSFALRNGSTLLNGGVFRAISNFDTADGTVFRNEGYGFITGELAFEGESDNYGLLEITTRVNVNPTASFKNYCTLLSLGSYNVNGTYHNEGLALVYANSGTLEFNVTSAGRVVQGPMGSIIVTSVDGVGGAALANIRVDGHITGEGLVYVEGTSICQGSGSVIGDPLLTFHDATPTGPHPIFDTMSGTVDNVIRGEAPPLPTLDEARLGRIGADCRTGLACEDDRPPGEIDTGCEEGLPACVVFDEINVCVECTDDLDCDRGWVCNVGVRRCQPGPPPVAVDDVLRVAEGSSVSATLASLAANDQHVEADTVSLGTPNHGSVVVLDGVLTYTPGTSPPAQASLPYTVCGIGPNAEVCDEGRVLILINRAPGLSGATLMEPVGLASTVLGLTPFYGDPDGHAIDLTSLEVLGVTTTLGALAGEASIIDGVLTFTPTDPAAPGVVAVSVRVCDLGDPPACGVGVVTLIRNDPPVLASVEVVVTRGTPGSFPLGTVLVGTGVVHGDDPGDGDTDGIGEVSVVSGPCTWNGQAFAVEPLGFTGETSCLVRVCEELPSAANGGPVCSEATVGIVVAGRTPIVRDDTATVLENGQVVIDVLDNDEDPDGDPLEIRDIVTGPEHGTVTIEDGVVTYVPDPGFSGTDTFTYRACDTDDMCADAVVTITVEPGPPDNRRPVAEDDVAEVEEDGQVIVDVLDNDLDPDGDPLELRDIVVEPEHGTATIEDGRIVYVPDPDFNGEDQFTYEVCDDQGLCDTATVTITVTPVNDPPVARDDLVGTEAGTSVTIDVLDNDEDVDGDELTIVGVSDVVGGTVLIEDGVIIFTPDPGFVGEGGFTYTVSDPDGEESSARVTVIVTDPDADTDPETGPEVGPEVGPEAPPESAESAERVEDEDELGEGLIATGGGGCAGGGLGGGLGLLAGLSWLGLGLRRRLAGGR